MSTNNVVPFPGRRSALPRIDSRRFATAFDLLTAAVIHDQRRRGEINPDTAAAYLATIEAPR
ncbi:hypothetical protein [Reyranella soli]|uniref:Uncharacterized protein n=1 Tax=Reyranella soli TaxID=1230389 RepID=A0A512NEG4_9HYPH|nr:hypothetical protein [Reyranella soli]GEP57328.1 hypothetical protein RSO01_44940 [Reyranella soli]